MSAQPEMIEGEAVEVSGSELSPARERSTALVAASQADRLLELALTRGADMATLERLMDLKERHEASEARKAFTSAMAAFKAEPMEILKRKHVEFRTRDGDVTSYQHAELSDITDVVCPAMAKHGLRHRWDVQQDGGMITVTCAVTHELGHSESVTMSAPPDASGKKNVIQQVASAITYLQRYTLLAITGMATKGMDDDGRGYAASEPERVESITEEQEAKLADLLEAAGKTREALLSVLKRGKTPHPIEALSDIPASWFERTVKLIGGAK